MDPTTERALQPRGILHQNTVAHRLAQALQRHEVAHVFGQSLPTMVHLANHELGIKQIAYRQENTGGYMADGYARISGKVGIVTAQNGPAAALLVPALMEALKPSIPMVALVQAGGRSQRGRSALQEMDHDPVFPSRAVWVRRVMEPGRIEGYVDVAFVAATRGRPGPGTLLLPVDVLLSPAPAQSGRTASL